jgi:hypothetical protein
MLAIEAQHLQQRHALGEITARDLQGSMEQLRIRRDIVIATRDQTLSVRERLASETAMRDQQSILLDHLVEMERIQARTTAERLQASERIHRLKRQELLNNNLLTEAEISNELYKLDLAREREQIQIRMMERVEKEASIIQSIAAEIAGIVLPGTGGGIGGAIGRGIGTAVGKSMGTFAGTVLAPGVGGLVGGFLGSKIGGLFGKKQSSDQPDRHLQILQKIQYNTRQTATELEHQRRKLDVARGVFNVPAGFAIPAMMGGGGHNITVNVNSAIHIPPQVSPQDVVNIMHDEMGRVIRTAVSRELGRNRSM